MGILTKIVHAFHRLKDGDPNAKIWWILPKGSAKLGPFNLEEVKKQVSTTRNVSLSIRRGTRDDWIKLLHAWKKYPELVRRSVVTKPPRARKGRRKATSRKLRYPKEDKAHEVSKSDRDSITVLVDSLRPALWHVNEISGRPGNRRESDYHYYSFECPYGESAKLDQVVRLLMSIQIGGGGDTITIEHKAFAGAWFCSGTGDTLIMDVGSRRKGDSQSGNSYYDIDETLYILRRSKDSFCVILHERSFGWPAEV